MRAALVVVALIALTGCSGAEPEAAPTVTHTVTAMAPAASGVPQACLDALDAADAAEFANGELISSMAEALTAAQDAMHALGSGDIAAFDDAFDRNDAAVADINTRDPKAVEAAAAYREARKECRG